MNIPKLVKFRNSSIAFFKRILSYRKCDWDLSDYPHFIRKQLNGSELSHGRPIPVFLAYVVGWNLTGTGNTPHEAQIALQESFINAKKGRLDEGKTIPRPGTEVPLEFASDINIERNRLLSDDFIQRVLEFQWAFMSDESRLWDFHSEISNTLLVQKIKDVYDVDVADIESGLLWEIFDRIAAKQVIRNTPA